MSVTESRVIKMLKYLIFEMFLKVSACHSEVLFVGKEVVSYKLNDLHEDYGPFRLQRHSHITNVKPAINTGKAVDQHPI